MDLVQCRYDRIFQRYTPELSHGATSTRSVRVLWYTVTNELASRNQSSTDKVLTEQLRQTRVVSLMSVILFNLSFHLFVLLKSREALRQELAKVTATCSSGSSRSSRR
jgi:hypothetical protein